MKKGGETLCTDLLLLLGAAFILSRRLLMPCGAAASVPASLMFTLQSPRESLLGEEFHDAIRYLNRHLPEVSNGRSCLLLLLLLLLVLLMRYLGRVQQDENIRYIPFDFQKMKRTSSHDVVIGCICRVVREATQESGIFCYQLAPGRGKQQQRFGGEDDKEEEEMIGSGGATIPDAANDSLIGDDTVITATTDDVRRGQCFCFPFNPFFPLLPSSLSPVSRSRVVVLTYCLQMCCCSTCSSSCAATVLASSSPSSSFHSLLFLPMLLRS